MPEYQGQSYGFSMLEELTAQGIEGELILDQDIAVHLSTVDMILIGADALYLDNYLINGYPSLEMLEASARLTPHVPVWALVDSIKIARDNKNIIMEPGFQKVPIAYLTGIISEQGVLDKM